MKKLILFIAVIILSNPVSAQFAFSVKPGLSFNGASFGYKFGNLVAFVGYDYNHVSGSIEQTVQEFDYGLNSLISVTNKTEASFSINNIGIGGKLFLPVEKDIKPYFTALFSKPFLSADLTLNEQTQRSVSDFVDDISIWSFSVGVGTEYFFTDNFSIGGEFGLRALFGNYSKSDKGSELIYTNGGYQNYTTNNEYKIDVNYSITYSVVALNYYF